MVTEHGPGRRAAWQAGDATAGVGLASMRERTGALGGTLEIDSSPGNGTTITVLLPLDGRAP